jgi:hypothetical protein
MSGLTIANGHAYNGAGILDNGDALTLDRMVLTGNVADGKLSGLQIADGGGITALHGASVKVTNSTFSGNRAAGIKIGAAEGQAEERVRGAPAAGGRRPVVDEDRIADVEGRDVVGHDGPAGAHLGGDGRAGLAVDDAPHEHLPGLRLEVGADQFQGAAVELAAQLPLLLVGLVGRVGVLEERPIGVGAAGRLDLPAEAAEVLLDAVAGDPLQPAAERAGVRGMTKRVQGGKGRGENLLGHVVAVLRRDAAAAAPVADQGLVQGNQPLPDGGVPVARPLQQAA